MRQQRACTDTQCGRAVAFQRVQNIIRLFQVRTDLAPLLGKKNAGFGQHNAISPAHHELSSDLGLKMRYSARQGWLRDGQNLGRRRQGTGLKNDVKMIQKLRVETDAHLAILPC